MGAFIEGQECTSGGERHEGPRSHGTGDVLDKRYPWSVSSSQSITFSMLCVCSTEEKKARLSV